MNRIEKIVLGSAACALALAFSTPSVAGEPIELLAIDHPQRDTTVTLFNTTERAPGAEVIAGTNYRDGKARVAIAYNELKPAALLGGDVTAYVVWAIEPDGHAENLGELTIRGDDDGRQEYTTALKEFALMITAEPHYLVQQPSALVMFHSTITNEKDAEVDPFVFEGLLPAPPHEAASLDAATRKLEAPVDLLQARKAFELAGRTDAAVVAPDDHAEARERLDEAERLHADGKHGRLFRDACRASVTHSHQAMVQSHTAAAEARELLEDQQRMLAERKAAAEGARAAAAEAEMQDAREDALAAEAQLRRTEAELREERERRQAIEGRLEIALSEIIETRRTERGLILNLPDVLFELDEARLTGEARERLAEAAAILSREETISLMIEGHTDSTGETAYNERLSEDRARAVGDFLVAHGVERHRIATVGFGESRPVADNSTPDGRQMNRRVEIVVGAAS